MTGAWFFAPPEAWTADRILLPLEESHHAARVLRVEAGDLITVVDGRGRIAQASVAGEKMNRLEVEVIEAATQPRAVPEVVLYQGIAKGHKLDDAVQRAAELGVVEFHAFESARSVARWDAEKLEKVERRWEAIARASAKVARSAHVMEVAAGLSFSELSARVTREPFAVVLWEEAAFPLRSALVDGVTRVALVVGPEGGFAADEVARLADAGAAAASLGPRIFRTESAAAAAVAAVSYRYGLLG